MADETTDVSTSEQLAVLVRTIGKDLFPEDIFLGFAEVTSTTGENLEAVITDILRRHELQISQCRGQAYDGAANMSGRLQGLQARIMAKEPKAIFLHCLNHCLNLSLQEIAKEEPLVGNAFQILNSVGVIIGGSAKRKNILASICLEQGKEAPSLSALCQTRWTCRTSAIRKCLANYPQIQEALESMELDAKSGFNARVAAKWLKKGEIFLGLRLSWDLFEMAEKVALSLQKSGISFADANEVVTDFLLYLEAIPHDELVKDAWEEMVKLGLGWPKEGRMRKKPMRLREEGEGEEGEGDEAQGKAQEGTVEIDTIPEKRARKPPKKFAEIQKGSLQEGGKEAKENVGEEAERERRGRELISKKFQGVTERMKKEVGRRFDQKSMEVLIAGEMLLEKALKGEIDENAK